MVIVLRKKLSAMTGKRNTKGKENDGVVRESWHDRASIELGPSPPPAPQPALSTGEDGPRAV